MMSGKPRFTGARQRTIAVVAILALGLTLTFILFQARLFAPTNRQGEFSQRAALGATALQRSMQEHLEVLYGLAALYATAAQPLSLNRESFRELTKGPLKRYPGIQSLGWIPRVSEAEREAYLAAARKDGIGDFQITGVDTKNANGACSTEPYVLSHLLHRAAGESQGRCGF